MGQSENLREQTDDKKRIHQSGESWSSKTRTSGCDQQIVLAPSILMTIREEPSKNYRSMTTEKRKAKEAKKQKIKRSDDE